MHRLALTLIAFCPTLVHARSPQVVAHGHLPASQLESACLSGSLQHCQVALKNYENGGQGYRYAEVSLKACNLGSKDGCHFYLLNSEARSTDFWQNRFDTVAPAPLALIELLRVDNVVNGFSERPVSATPNPQFVTLLKEALREIPPGISKALDRKLVGIFLVENLGSTAYSLGLFDESGPSAMSLIVLDVTKLTKNANAWATWKENTPFKKDPNFSIEVSLENEASNDVKNAIQYIILHEMGHVLERAGKHNPTKDEAPNPVFLRQFPFLAQSWTVVPKVGYKTRFDEVFPERSKIRFYSDRAENKIPSATATEIYRKLESTNFPTLYAATNPWDDFAESFVGYVHSVIQKRPYQVVLKRNQRAIQFFKSCWDSPRCKEKRQYFDKIFQTNGMDPLIYSSRASRESQKDTP